MDRGFTREERGRIPPCAAACPVSTDTRRYVEAVLRGSYEEALDLLLSANPFTSRLRTHL